MHFRSTALRNSLLTLRSRRPFERVFFFFFVLPDEISEWTVTLRSLDGMMSASSLAFFQP
jgi:hypothetical protein